MIALLFSNPLAFLTAFPALLLSISTHEFAHAWAADKLGDPTPRYQGRLTLDPRAHLDPLGVIALLLTRFGWGKPVQFDPYNLREPIRDTAIIAVAGPIVNLLIASVAAVILKVWIGMPDWLVLSLVQTVLINITLAVFNFVPVHPLDGSKILTALLPASTALEYQTFMERYGLFVLVALLLPWNGQSPLSSLISPVIALVSRILL